MAPYQMTKPKSCMILVDRHVHKNGGSSVRDLLLENERRGYGLYQGYTQMYWNRDLKQLQKAGEAARQQNRAPSHVIMMEAHFGWVEFATSTLPGLKNLASTYEQQGVDCPLVLMTRVRDPLEYYLSFYRWGVAFRQKESPLKFGKSFVEWARKVPNLQSTIMMLSMAAMAAEYHPDTWKHYSRRPEIGRSPEEAWRKLSEFLDQFAIVGTMRRFDESLLLMSDMTGLPVMEYRRNRPNQKGGFKGLNKDVCPDMEACRKVVQEVAGRDTQMYETYSAQFEKKLQDLGDNFAARVKSYKKALDDIQPFWSRVPRKQFICRYHPESTVRDEVLRLDNIRCPVQDAPGLCQSVYAHRLFECPWQFQPNSSLSDSLGCWRKSSGFN